MIAVKKKFMTYVALFWLSWLMGYGLLTVFIENSIIYQQQLSPIFRFSLIAFEALLVAPVCLLLASIMWQRSFTLALIKWPLMLFSVLAMAISWGMFYFADFFLGFNSLEMFVNDPTQIIQHFFQMNWRIPVFASLAALLLTGYFIRLLYFISLRLSCRLACLIRLLTLLLLIALLVFYLVCANKISSLDGFLISRKDKISYRIPEYYTRMRDQHTGPISYLFAELKFRWRDLSHHTIQQQYLGLKRRDIIPISQYLATIQPGYVSRYNVIVLLIESLRPDVLPVFGGEHNIMPQLNQLASESLQFSRVYSQSSHSNYADLGPLTSRYPLYSPQMYYYPAKVSYPRVLMHGILHELGYKTAIISSQNENWGNMLNYLHAGHLDHLFHAATYSGELMTHELKGKTNLTRLYAQSMVAGTRYGKVDDAETMADALSWIKKTTAQPFFLYMNLQNSHYPYVTPEHFQRLYDPNNVEPPVKIAECQHQTTVLLKNRYADSLRYIDRQIEKLVATLKQTQQWQHTILVVSGDTATAFCEHEFYGNAAVLLDEVVRVPMVIHVPGQPPQRINQLTQHIDLPPMLFDLLGLPAHPSFQGLNKLKPHAEPVFLVAQSPIAYYYAIVDGNDKLIYDLRGQRAFLYDLAADPLEQQSINFDKQNRRHQQLFQMLTTWVAAQIEYHKDEAWHRYQYPPSYYKQGKLS